MALTKECVYQVEVTENDHVQVRCKTLILEDGELISSSLHRHVISPGQDASKEPGKVRRVVANTHIPTVVDFHKAKESVKAAKQARQDNDTPATRKALRLAKKARDAARDAHKAFIDSE